MSTIGSFCFAGSGGAPCADRGGRAIGAMFCAFFGALWFAGACVLAGAARSWLLGLIGAAALALFLVSYRVFRHNRAALRKQGDSPQGRRIRRAFALVNAMQWVAALAVVNILANIGLSAWVVPSIILIVGLHFLPLARLFDYRPHYVSGIALVLLALTYPWLSRSGPQDPAGCLGAGIVLWTTAAWSLSAARRPDQT